MLQQPALLGGELRDGERLGLCAFQALLSLGAYRALGAVECVECRLSAVVVPVGHRALAHRQVPVGADEHVRVLVEGEAVAPVYPRAEVGVRWGEQLEGVLPRQLEDGLPGVGGVAEHLVDLEVAVGQHLGERLPAGQRVAHLAGGDPHPDNHARLGVHHDLRLVAEELGVGALVPDTGVGVDGAVRVVVGDVVHQLPEAVEHPLDAGELSGLAQQALHGGDECAAVLHLAREVPRGYFPVGPEPALHLGKERVDLVAELLRPLLQRGHGPVERGGGDGVGAVDDGADVYPVVVRAPEDALALGHLEGLGQQQVGQVGVPQARPAELAQRGVVHRHLLRGHVEEELVGHVHPHLVDEVHVRELGDDLQYKVLEHHHRVVGRAPHALRVLVHELPVDEREVDVIMKPPKEMVGRNENVIQSRVLAQNEFLLLCNHTSKLLKTNELHK